MPQYNGVWTLEQQAQAQSNQQWVTDPNFKNTTLLLQADGAANGAQNNLFLDTSSNQFAVTRYGNTTQGSLSPFSQAPGYWSNYFSGGYLRTTSSTALGFSTNPFTIEAWVYMVDRSAQYYLIGGSGVSMQVSIRTDGKIVLGAFAEITPSTGTVPLNTWTHIAFVRSSTSTNGFAYYINGEPSGTTTLTNDLGTASAIVEVATTNTGLGVTAWTGYISNIRVVKGTAVYTGAFTPSTTPLTAITNTSLLTCQSNRFVDNSSANATFTTANSSAQTFSPFAPALQWTPTVVGGSGYFDGSGDYLTVPSNAAFDFGSGDATIEAWIYPTSSSQTCGIFDKRSSGANYSQFPQIALNSGALVILVSYSGSSWAVTINGATPTANTWSHIALVRNGNTWTLYVNGVVSGTPVTASGSVYASTDSLSICASTSGGLNPFVGYVSNARVVKGTAVYTSAFTPPTTPLTAITNTSLLLNYTNAGIYDGKMGTSWETVNSTQVSTNPVKVGSGSIYFNGVASQRLLPSQLYPQLTFGTGDFTIECWLYCIGKGASAVNGIIDYRPGVNGTYVNWVLDFGGYGQGSTTAPKLVLYADSAVFIASNVYPLAQWNHIALCRANGITRMFINGVLASTPTADTKNYGSGGSAGNYRPTIGCTDGGDSMYGYMDDFRVSRFARYVANFTPPQQALPRQ